MIVTAVFAVSWGATVAHDWTVRQLRRLRRPSGYDVRLALAGLERICRQEAEEARHGRDGA